MGKKPSRGDAEERHSAPELLGPVHVPHAAADVEQGVEEGQGQRLAAVAELAVELPGRLKLFTSKPRVSRAQQG